MHFCGNRSYLLMQDRNARVTSAVNRRVIRHIRRLRHNLVRQWPLLDSPNVKPRQCGDDLYTSIFPVTSNWQSTHRVKGADDTNNVVSGYTFLTSISYLHTTPKQMFSIAQSPSSFKKNKIDTPWSFYSIKFFDGLWSKFTLSKFAPKTLTNFSFTKFSRTRKLW